MLTQLDRPPTEAADPRAGRQEQRGRDQRDRRRRAPIPRGGGADGARRALRAPSSTTPGCRSRAQWYGRPQHRSGARAARRSRHRPNETSANASQPRGAADSPNRIHDVGPQTAVHAGDASAVSHIHDNLQGQRLSSRRLVTRGSGPFPGGDRRTVGTPMFNRYGPTELRRAVHDESIFTSPISRRRTVARRRAPLTRRSEHPCSPECADPRRGCRMAPGRPCSQAAPAGLQSAQRPGPMRHHAPFAGEATVEERAGGPDQASPRYDPLPPARVSRATDTRPREAPALLATPVNQPRVVKHGRAAPEVRPLSQWVVGSLREARENGWCSRRHGPSSAHATPLSRPGVRILIEPAEESHVRPVGADAYQAYESTC